MRHQLTDQYDWQTVAGAVICRADVDPLLAQFNRDFPEAHQAVRAAKPILLAGTRSRRPTDRSSRRSARGLGLVSDFVPIFRRHFHGIPQLAQRGSCRHTLTTNIIATKMFSPDRPIGHLVLLGKSTSSIGHSNQTTPLTEPSL